MLSLWIEQSDPEIVLQNGSWISPVHLTQEIFEIADPPSHELLNKRIRLVPDAKLCHLLRPVRKYTGHRCTGRILNIRNIDNIDYNGII